MVLAYTEDSVWRNRTEFPVGRDQIRQFLAGKWDRELDYRLVKGLWAFTADRIAVKFEYEWHDQEGHWFRSYGNELWEFDDRGLMRRREASINDRPILESDRKFFWPAPAPGRRTIRESIDHPRPIAVFDHGGHGEERILTTDFTVITDENSRSPLSYPWNP